MTAPSVYPPSLPDVGLSSRASPAYRRKVLVLLANLASLALTYVVLLVGCTAMIVVTVMAAIADPWMWVLVAIVIPCFAPIGGFLLGALVLRSAATRSTTVLAPDEHPRLWTFLQALASDADAPVPERVSLVPGVNAAMVRGRSTLGSLLGGRRELVIGLGLVNVLDLREFKAVLAHEFGHFAQSSTRVGQWAHRVTMMLQGIATGRTALDHRLAAARRGRNVLLRGLGALLEVGVRGARGALVWRLVRITHSSQALARELEFNADLHSVRLCGSDPLVAALWHAQRGALAMNATLGALGELSKHGLFSDDLYLHHDARIEQLDDQLMRRDDPMSVALRTPYVYGSPLHFPPGDAPAQIMWYAHPSYREREANAKRDYLAVEDAPAPSAWVLFEGVAELRQSMSERAYANLGRRPGSEPLRPAAEVELRLHDEFDERRQDPRYHGFYDNRIVDPGPLEALVRALEHACDQPEIAAQIEAQVQAWRGSQLELFMQGWRDVDRRLAALEPGHERVQVEQLRARQIAAAQEGDQLMFRSMWLRANSELRAELLERHTFAQWVQARILAFNEHHVSVGTAFVGLDPRSLVRADAAPAPLRAALANLRDELEQVLAAAPTQVLPPLRNLEPGSTLRTALGKLELVAPLEDLDELSPWLGALMGAVGEVHGRLRTLHYKNLGQLLALHEQIEALAPECVYRAIVITSIDPS